LSLSTYSHFFPLLSSSEIASIIYDLEKKRDVWEKFKCLEKGRCLGKPISLGKGEMFANNRDELMSDIYLRETKGWRAVE
jgi:hypothetical protein